MINKKNQFLAKTLNLTVPKIYFEKNVVTQSRTGLQIYEGHDDQLSRPGPMA
jgi:hypothetical protein